MDEINIEKELNEAEIKAQDALARYKFMMFGYWAAIWVHFNHLSKTKRSNPFKPYVQLAIRSRERGNEEARRELRK